MNKKRILALGLSCISVISVLSGCSKKIDYTGDNFDKTISDALEISDKMESKVNQAVSGEYYEKMDVEALITPTPTPDNSVTPIETVKPSAPVYIPTETSAKLPSIVFTDAKHDIGVSECFEVGSGTESYLGYDFTHKEYSGKNKMIAGWVYEIKFEAESGPDLLDQFMRYTNAISNNFGPNYGSSKYNRVTISDVKDIGNYQAIYKADDIYVTNVVTEFDIEAFAATCHLTFINSKSEQWYDRGGYKKELDPLWEMVKDGNILPDWSLLITRTIDMQDINSDIYIDDPDMKVYKKLYPDETDVPEVTPEPISEATDEPTVAPEETDSPLIPDTTPESVESPTEPVESGRPMIILPS